MNPLDETIFLSAEWFQQKSKEQEYVSFLTQVNQQLSWFRDRFSIDKLKALSGINLLRTLFYSDIDTKDNLCYVLEMNSDIKANFGSIAGGSAFKFGLFFHRQMKKWVTGSPQKPKELTIEEALQLGEEIRDNIVTGADEIARFREPTCESDYEELKELIQKHIRLDNIWILKYYKMLFPALFSTAYGENQQRHMLYALQIQPANNPFVRSGQLALFSKKCGLQPEIMGKIFADYVGWYKAFYRMDTKLDLVSFNEWQTRMYCSIDSCGLGNFTDYIDSKGKADKERINSALLAQGSYDTTSASKKANEIVDYINSPSNETMIVVTNGMQILGIGKLSSGLVFDNHGNNQSNRRKVEWCQIPNAVVYLPVSEGQQTLFVKMNNEKNMMLVYNLLYHENNIGISLDESWWPSLEEYDPGITADAYHDYFLNERVVKRTWLEALFELYQMPGHLGTCKQLADKYGYKPGHYISFLSTAAANIAKESNCPLTTNQDASKYWPVLFVGREVSDKSQGSYCWKMREPVVEAIETLIKEGLFDTEEYETMKPFDHNTILYGPPGTGKTYNSVIYAVAICEGKELDEVKAEAYESYDNVLKRYIAFKEAGQIEFITFHQSYSYEEFIEGIKPKLSEDDDTLGYTIEDGVFKAFCNRAKAVKVQTPTQVQMKEHPRIWGMILGGSGMTKLKKQCFENNEVRLGWDQIKDDAMDGDYGGDSSASWQGRHMVSDFRDSMSIGDIVVIEKNINSIDAIGVITGEYVNDTSSVYYPRSRAVKWLVKDIDEDMTPYLPNGRKHLARFSLFAFDYIGMDVISKILSKYQNEPVIEVEQETKPYVFIIDEINRGNISKIFGELITLLEDTKRAGASEAMEAILPYSGEIFSVPKNVYILGTMNTADRSIALMDTALRRRFEFVEMMPDPSVLEKLGIGTIIVDGNELNVARMLKVINERIEYLYDREHTIGHAFFTKLKDDPTIETLAGIFRKKVIPLLQEYFYEDYEKIQLVLGDNSKNNEFKFVRDRHLNIQDIFKGDPDVDLPEKGYTIQYDAFLKLESYKQIGKDL